MMTLDPKKLAGVARGISHGFMSGTSFYEPLSRMRQSLGASSNTLEISMEHKYPTQSKWNSIRLHIFKFGWSLMLLAVAVAFFVHSLRPDVEAFANVSHTISNIPVWVVGYAMAMIMFVDAAFYVDRPKFEVTGLLSLVFPFYWLVAVTGWLMFSLRLDETIKFGYLGLWCMILFLYAFFGACLVWFDWDAIFFRTFWQPLDNLYMQGKSQANAAWLSALQDVYKDQKASIEPIETAANAYFNKIVAGIDVEAATPTSTPTSPMGQQPQQGAYVRQLNGKTRSTRK
jgi:hypothetical protein